MKLQTIVEIPQPQKQIDYNSKLLLIGSCFTENIGKMLQYFKFDSFLNPCGIAYNPASVNTSVQFLTGQKKLQESDLIQHNDLWHSLHHHGCFSAKSKETLLQNISAKTEEGKHHLCNATHIFLTLGTAWIFEHIATQQIVNNCHKIPTSAFRRKRLSVEECTQFLSSMITQIQSLNPSAEIIFTVSPVRHKKDGLHENQLSKATLLLAIAEVQKQQQNVSYFPAYELAIDELRDYRFFAADFCHLNELGTSYIWEKFATHYIATEAQQHFGKIDKLQKALNHKVQDRKSEAYQTFQEKIAQQISSLEKQLPMVDFSVEKLTF